MPLPSQRQLYFFQTLAKTRNFSRAAEVCGVSQPSLSNGIKELERFLSCRLFERNTRYVQISDIGARLLPLAEANLARWEHGIADLEKVAKNRSTVIRIAAVTTLTSDILPKALSHFKEIYPNIDIDVTDVISPEAEDAVHSGACDMGICLAPIDEKKFDNIRVTSDNLAVYCLRSHSLARHTRLSWANVFDHPVVSFSSPSAIFSNIQMVYEQHARKFEPVSTFRYQSSLLGMVANGDYFTILPSLMAQDDRPSDIVVIPLENPVVTRHYMLIRPKLERHLPSHRILFEYLSEQLDQLCRMRVSAIR